MPVPFKEEDTFDITLENGTVIQWPNKKTYSDEEVKQLENIIAQNKKPVSGFELAAQKWIDKGQRALQTTPGRVIAQAGKQAAAPIAGSVIGRAGGQKIAGPVGGFLGETLGGVGGELVNQATGITEPSLKQLGVEAITPTVTRGVVAVGRPAAKLLGGTLFPASGARILNDLAPHEARLVVERLAPADDYLKLYQKAKLSGNKIPMVKTMSWLNQTIEDLGKFSKPPKDAINRLTALQQKIIKNGGLDPVELDRELRLFGQLKKKMARKSEIGTGEINNTFKQMAKDLDSAKDIPGFNDLRLGRAAFKRKTVIDEIDEAIWGSRAINRGQGGDLQFNSNKVIQKLEQNPFFKDALSAQEQKDILKLFKKLNKIPPLPPGAGVSFGSGQTAAQFRSGLVGAGAGGVMGSFIGERAQKFGAGIGFLAGVSIGPTERAVKLISKAIMWESGRNLIGNLMTKGGVLSPQAMSILGQFVAAQSREIEKLIQSEQPGPVAPAPTQQ